MIVPDLNLLVYAYNTSALLHHRARLWWRELLTGTEVVGLPWIVSIGFVRLATMRGILPSPMSATQAIDIVHGWLRHDHVQSINPGVAHLDHLYRIANVMGVNSNLVTDAHIAAIAIEYDAIVHTNDSDFARFPGVHCHFPLR